MIRLHNIFHRYDKEHLILRDVSLRLDAGGFYFLGGPSGAGKSTLMSIIALMRRPTHGSLTLFGHEINSKTPINPSFLRREIGTVYQDFRLLDHLTVLQNIALPLKVMGEKRRHCHEKAQEMARWVGLSNEVSHYPPTLSGGQKQRVAIARAVITNPKLILADEPSGNLDRALSERFMYLFSELHRQGTTILYATHDDELMKRHPYPILRLENGKVQSQPAAAIL